MKMGFIREFQIHIKHLKANFEVLKNIKVKKLALKNKKCLKIEFKKPIKDCIKNLKNTIFFMLERKP